MKDDVVTSADSNIIIFITELSVEVTSEHSLLLAPSFHYDVIVTGGLAINVEITTAIIVTHLAVTSLQYSIAVTEEASTFMLVTETSAVTPSSQYTIHVTVTDMFTYKAGYNQPSLFAISV